VNPDPDWIQIQEGKNDPEEKTVSSSEVLDVLFLELKASHVAWRYLLSEGLVISKLQYLI
jgi:hypothetical protein